MSEEKMSDDSEKALHEAERCPHCGAEVEETTATCPLCQAELLGTFSINQELIEESVEKILAVLAVEFDLKKLRLADDTQQLIARAKIRELVREDDSTLTIFERGVVLQHLLNITFNSREDCSAE
jgi:hypothetical protein